MTGAIHNIYDRDDKTLRHENDMTKGRATLHFSVRHNCWVGVGGVKIYARETAVKYLEKLSRLAA